MKRPSIKQLTLGGATVLGMIGFASPAAFAMSGNNHNYNTSSRYSNHRFYNDYDYHNNRHCDTRHLGIRYTSYNKYHQHTPKCLHQLSHKYY